MSDWVIGVAVGLFLFLLVESRLQHHRIKLLEEQVFRLMLTRPTERSTTE